MTAPLGQPSNVALVYDRAGEWRLEVVCQHTAEMIAACDAEADAPPPVRHDPLADLAPCTGDHRCGTHHHGRPPLGFVRGAGKGKRWFCGWGCVIRDAHAQAGAAPRHLTAVA